MIKIFITTLLILIVLTICAGVLVKFTDAVLIKIDRVSCLTWENWTHDHKHFEPDTHMFEQCDPFNINLRD